MKDQPIRTLADREIGGLGRRGWMGRRGLGTCPLCPILSMSSSFKDKIAVKNSLASIYYFSHSTIVGSAKVQDSTVFEYTCLVTCDLL